MTESTIQIFVSEPTFPEATTITKEDVWGKFSDDHRTQIHNGMIVQRGKGGKVVHTKEGTQCFPPEADEDICPIWGDQLEYKNVTVVFEKHQYDEVIYWLEYVHGAGCIVKERDLPEGKMAIRSEYMCW